MANREQVTTVLNYLIAKRRYVVVAYKPGSRCVPEVGALIQEWSAHFIGKLLRIRARTDRADWDEQFAIAKRKFPKIFTNSTTEVDEWPGGIFLRASFGRRHTAVGQGPVRQNLTENEVIENKE